jgi:hypothetical protein
MMIGGGWEMREMEFLQAAAGSHANRQSSGRKKDDVSWKHVRNARKDRGLGNQKDRGFGDNGIGWIC